MPRITCKEIKKRESLVVSLLFILSMVAIVPIAFSIGEQGSGNGPTAQIPSAFPAVDTIVVPAKVADMKDATGAPRVVQATPQAHLKIPKIGVDAVITDVGVTEAGAMAVPNNALDVGWFRFGTKPGETGSSVIGAHSVWDSMPGVFARLDQLQKGDTLTVVDATGNEIYFVVRDVRTYDAADTNSGIFESEEGVHLNLITCSGEWDSATQTYTTRLVVFTDVVETSSEIAMAPRDASSESR